MLMLDTGATTALTRAAPGGCQALSASPTASGISMSTMSDRAMLAGFDGNALDQQREDDRHDIHGDDHEHDHQADGERHVALRQIRQLEKKGRAGGDATQQQSDAEWFIQAEHSGKPDRDKRRQHEVREQGQHDQPAVPQRRKNLRNGKTETNRQVLETTNTTTETFAPLISKSVSGMASALRAL